MLLINGKPADTIRVEDRGLQYGDGLFETLAVRGGQPSLWQRHMQRLRRDCGRLGIGLPAVQLLKDELLGLIGSQDSGVAKIILTRGVGPRGYRPADTAEATRIISFTAETATTVVDIRKPAVVRLCQTPLGSNPVLAGMKHLNRLEQVLARREWRDEMVHEGLMFDMNERVIEGTQSNLFLVRKGQLFTPDLRQSGVAGVMRGLVIDLAKELKIPLTEGPLGLSDLWSAEGAFLTSSLIGIWPVIKIADHHFSVDSINRQLFERVMIEAFLP